MAAPDAGSLLGILTLPSEILLKCMLSQAQPLCFECRDKCIGLGRCQGTMCTCTCKHRRRWLEDPRLLCRAVSQAMRHAVELLPHEWILSDRTNDSTLRALTAAFPNLHSVSINHPEMGGGHLSSPCRGVRGDGIAALSNLRGLKKLEMHSLTALTGDDLARLATSDPPRDLKLGSLILTHGLCVTNHSASAVASVCPELRTLIFATSPVSDVGITEVSRRCPALTTVVLKHCHAITDNGVEALTMCCTGLKTFEISNSQHLTDNGVCAIATRCRALTQLDISLCPTSPTMHWSHCHKGVQVSPRSTYHGAFLSVTKGWCHWRVVALICVN